MNQPFSNIAGELERILNEMWSQLREAMPNLKRDICISIISWEYKHFDQRENKFVVWDGNKADHIKVAALQKRPSDASCDIPLKNWDKFINVHKKDAFRNEILFRKF